MLRRSGTHECQTLKSYPVFLNQNARWRLAEDLPPVR